MYPLKYAKVGFTEELSFFLKWEDGTMEFSDTAIGILRKYALKTDRQLHFKIKCEKERKNKNVDVFNTSDNAL